MRKLKICFLRCNGPLKKMVQDAIKNKHIRIEYVCPMFSFSADAIFYLGSKRTCLEDLRDISHKEKVIVLVPLQSDYDRQIKVEVDGYSYSRKLTPEDLEFPASQMGFLGVLVGMDRPRILADYAAETIEEKFF